MGHLQKASLGKAPGLTHKYKIKQERPVSDKHSILLRKFVIYGRKKFYNIGTRAHCYKTFYVCNLRIFVISPGAGPRVEDASLGRATALSPIIRLGSKYLPGTNTLSYYEHW